MSHYNRAYNAYYLALCRKACWSLSQRTARRNMSPKEATEQASRLACRPSIWIRSRQGSFVGQSQTVCCSCTASSRASSLGVPDPRPQVSRIDASGSSGGHVHDGLAQLVLMSCDLWKQAAHESVPLFWGMSSYRVVTLWLSWPTYLPTWLSTEISKSEAHFNIHTKAAWLIHNFSKSSPGASRNNWEVNINVVITIIIILFKVLHLSSTCCFLIYVLYLFI